MSLDVSGQTLEIFQIGVVIRESLKVAIVSSTYILMGRYNHSLSFDATIMISKYCLTIGEHVVTIS